LAAYAVAHGLAGDPLAGFGVPIAQASVASVAIETDDAVDDVRIVFASGLRALVQAKRTLTAGKPLKETARQWGSAVRAGGFDILRDRLVLVGAQMSGTMRTLARALERSKTEQPGEFTGAERASLDALGALLPELTSVEMSALLRCAVIFELDVEEEHSSGAGVARALLGRVVGPGDTAVRAWRDLVAHCGRVARLRGGFSLEGWVRLLADDGHSFDNQTPAKATSDRITAVDAYRASLRRRGSVIDLRPLGLAAPPIPLSDLDASVHCLPPGAERRDHEHLPWALLRRQRIILTGLPGGGKSVALAAAAAVLSDAAGSPMPALVSLREVDDLPHTRGFADRLLDVAVKGLLEPGRTMVRATLERGLGSGETALLLDSLDETHQHRGEVVAELAEFSEAISSDVPILLATRDVAYAQASTLGWDALRLEAPEHPQRAVRAVLTAVAASRRVDNPEVWVETRLHWVDVVMSGDRAIRETPLMPVLLALLAAERHDGSLPTTRARILYAMVEAAASRREVRRGDGLRVASLDETTSTDALLAAFAVEARTLANAGGRASLATVESAVAAELVGNWGVPPGAASSGSSVAAHFWDEIGCLVISGEDDLVMPRLELFLDIGDAIGVGSMSPEEIAAWVRARVHDRRLEAIILAAALDDLVAEHFVSRAVEEGVHELLVAATDAIRQGALVTNLTRERLIDALGLDARHADVEGWKALLAILDLAPRHQDVDLEDLVAAYPEDHQRMATAVWHLRLLPEDGVADDSILVNALRVTKLDRLPSRSAHSASLLDAFRSDSIHDDVHEIAARRLLGRVPEATGLVVELLRHAPMTRYHRLLSALSDAGLGAAAAPVIKEMTRNMPDLQTLFGSYDPDQHTRLVDHLASKVSIELSPSEAARLDELADLFKTLDLHEMSGWPPRDLYPSWENLVDAVTEIGGFAHDRLAAEAAVLRHRIDQFGYDPFFSLEIASTRRALDGWERLDDPRNTASHIVPGLFMGESTAAVAARAFAEAPRKLARPFLVKAVARLASSRRLQYIAAWALACVSDSAILDQWAADPSPALRLVAAGYLSVTVDGEINQLLKELCRDPDRAVAKAAIERAAEAGAAAAVLLEAIASAGVSQWVCDRCGKENSGRLDFCIQCRVAPPNPKKAATELLLKVRSEASDGIGTSPVDQ
jgi:hypothetical protein